MKYVIIGGDAAGMSAAMQIFKYDQSAEITVLEKGETYSYAQCGMPYVISGDIASGDDLVIRSADVYQNKFGMDARTKHEVRHIDKERKVVEGLNKHSYSYFSIPYDRLLIATGAEPNIPRWDGMDFANVHVLKDLTHMNGIIDQVTDDVKNVTIIGGGYIGLEVAESFQKLGKVVTLINRGNSVGKMFDKDMAAHIHEEAKKQGIHFVFNENTLQFTGENRATKVVTDKHTYETDLIIVSIGIHPSTQFLASSGIEMTEKGAIIVNERLETSVEDIYAAGDCATQYHRIKKRDDYIPLGTNANKQGRIAGMNMADVLREYKGTLGTAILKFMDVTFGTTGLSEGEASGLGLNFDAVTIKSKHIAGYYPGAEDIYVKIVYEKESRRLLGAQVVGRLGVDKRLDVLAVALYNEMTVDELEDVDISYAPPYNSVWDPVQSAARKAK